jgi:hypothetical protein
MKNNIPEIDSTLSHKEIRELVQDYIKEDIYQYALLLDGEWGSGKSYFIENSLIDEIERAKHKAVYISLYGISSLDMLHTTVINAYWAKVSPNIDMLFKVTTALSPAFNIIPYLAPIKDIANDLQEKARDKSVDLKESFFIFDDLERCSVPIHDVLGYINNLIEHHGCKVLIVSNEAECARVTTQSHSEIQLIASALLKDYIKLNTQQAKNIELADIRKFSNELFGQNELYISTKEKLIGKTIKYVPQLEIIVPEIISAVFPSGEDQSELKDDIAKTCIYAMTSEKTINLRILQYALSYFKKIYDLVLDIDKDVDIGKETLLVVLNAIIRVAVRARVKNKDHLWDVGWDQEEAYALVNCFPGDKTIGFDDPDHLEFVNAFFFSFRFVHKYVIAGIIDQDETINDLSAYMDIEIEKKKLSDDPYTIVYKGWWILNETELHAYIEQMETKLLNDGYSAHMCILVLHLILRYSQELECEIGHPDDLFAHIKERIISGVMPIDLAYDNYLSLDMPSGKLRGAYQKRFDGYIFELREIIVQRKDTKLIHAINQFEGDDWSSRFAEEITSREDGMEFFSRKAFLALIDVDAMLRRLDRAHGTDYQNLLTAFRSIYNFKNLNDYYTADIPNLKKLIGGLNDITIEDGMIRRSRNYLVEELEGWHKKISRE